MARLAGGAGEDPFQGWHVRVVPSGGDQHVAEAGEPAVRRVEPPPAPGVAPRCQAVGAWSVKYWRSTLEETSEITRSSRASRPSKSALSWPGVENSSSAMARPTRALASSQEGRRPAASCSKHSEASESEASAERGKRRSRSKRKAFPLRADVVPARRAGRLVARVTPRGLHAKAWLSRWRQTGLTPEIGRRLRTRRPLPPYGGRRSRYRRARRPAPGLQRDEERPDCATPRGQGWPHVRRWRR